jgi:hypothetical protein
MRLKTRKQQTVKPPQSRSKLAVAAVIAGITAVGFVLNIIGISWGSTGYIPWHDDSIAGITVVREMPRLSGDWTYKYPPLQFMINSVFYKPLLKKWEQNPQIIQMPDGRTARQALSYDRINMLILISNFISAIMAAAIIVAVYQTAKVLFDDPLAGVFSSLTVALCQLFVLFGHLGNIDMPAAFWFAFGVMFIVKAVCQDKWRHYILTGICFACSVSTKDSMPSYIFGSAVAAAVMLVTNKARQDSLKKAFAGLFDLKIIIAIIIFLGVYAAVNGVLTNPDVYMKRISIWLGGRGVKGGWDKDFTGQWPLLLRTLGLLAAGYGWPLISVIFVSTIYCLIKYKEKALIAFLPLLTFYLIVTVNIHFVFDRYLVPALSCLAVTAGKGVADWLRWKKLPIVYRVLPVVIIYALSLLYCIGLDLEMRNDSRYAAEDWFVKNVRPNEHIAVLCDIRWSPRLHLTNLNFSYRRSYNNIGGTTEDVLRTVPAYPKYVCVLAEHLKIFDPAFRQQLADGTLGYKQIEIFSNKYLYPKLNMYSLAGWGLAKPYFVSPDVLIFEKQ